MDASRQILAQCAITSISVPSVTSVHSVFRLDVTVHFNAEVTESTEVAEEGYGRFSLDFCALRH